MWMNEMTTGQNTVAILAVIIIFSWVFSPVPKEKP